MGAAGDMEGASEARCQESTGIGGGEDFEMTRQVYKRTVHVWAIPHVISVYQKSKTVWIAIGDYMGERIEVEGSSANVTAKWADAARVRGN